MFQKLLKLLKLKWFTFFQGRISLRMLIERQDENLAGQLLSNISFILLEFEENKIWSIEWHKTMEIITLLSR